MHPMVLGIDVGSVAVSLAVIGPGKKWLDWGPCDPSRGCRRGAEPGAHAAERARGRVGCRHRLRTCCDIRAHGRYDTLVSLITGCRAYHPGARSILHVGGERFGLVQFDEDGRYTSYRTNTTCAAGTGGFLDQQARRLNLSGAGELGEVALRSTGPAPPSPPAAPSLQRPTWRMPSRRAFPCPRFAMACAVGWHATLSNPSSTERPSNRRWFSAAAFPAMGPWLRHLNRMLGIELICEEGPLGAAGAALCLLDETGPRPERAAPMPGRHRSARFARRRVYAFAPLELKQSEFPNFTGTHLTRFTRPGSNDENPVEVEIHAAWEATRPLDCVLGIDVGSTSTKAALVTPTGAVAAGVYTRTAGKPIAAVQSLLGAIADIGRRRAAPVADHRWQRSPGPVASWPGA